MKEIRSYREFRTALANESDDKYREFTMKGVPSKRPFIGVRIPKIREIVTRVPIEKVADFIEEEPIAIEEVLARGMLISRLSYEKMLDWFDSQIRYIDNWCCCDIFCTELRGLIKKHRQEFLELKIEPLLRDSSEFSTRVGLVLLKSYYVDFDYLNLIFDRVEMLARREEYYVRMAIAWLVAECFIKYPEDTFAYLKVSKLPKWTYNKTISKICDSYRIESEDKDVLGKMRK